MQGTILRRTTVTVVGVLIVVAVGLGIVRDVMIDTQHGRDTSHDQGSRDAGISRAASEGAALFTAKGCAQCHSVDSKGGEMAPGLKNLFNESTLPVSGSATTEKNVRSQLQKPYKNMPSFAERLTKKERDRIIIYLKTL